MKYLVVTFALLMCAFSVKAEELSSCHGKCFDTHASCMKKDGHTWNGCESKLFACKSSCESGKSHETYAKSSALEVAFNPVMEIDLL